jgi:uncharacterized protein
MTAPPAVTPRAAAPTSMKARAIAPDLARGLMLLFIAIANAPWYLWADENGMIGSHAAEGSPADLVAQTVAIVFIDGRSYPMFAFLFGYGIVQLYRRQQEAGVSHRDARRLLRKRHWWMLAFGAVHAALLWYGDILGAYGIAGLLLCWWFLDRRDATIRVWAIVLTSLLIAGAALAALGGVMVSLFVPSSAMTSFATEIPIPDPNAQSNYLLSILERLGSWAFITPLTATVSLVVPIAILVAFLAARARVLDEPREHRTLLRRTAVIGLGVGWGTGILLALQNLGVWGVSRDLDWAFLSAHTAGGLFGGLGYVALFGLIAIRLQRRESGGVSRALQAVGKRSLTSYLAQSVIFAPLLCAWGLGLGQYFTSWSILLFAIGVWLVTVVIAVLLDRAGRRGPAEWMLRRLVYPRSS